MAFPAFIDIDPDLISEGEPGVQNMVGFIFDVMKTAVVDILLGYWTGDCSNVGGIEGWLPNVPDLKGL